MSYTMTTLNDSSQTLAYAEMDEVLDTPATPSPDTEMKLWLFRKRLIKQLPNDGTKLLLREKVKRKIYDCNF